MTLIEVDNRNRMVSTTNVVLGDIDLNFRGQTFEVLISRNCESYSKNASMIFTEDDIRHRMESLRMLYSTICA